LVSPKTLNGLYQANEVFIEKNIRLPFASHLQLQLSIIAKPDYLYEKT